MVQNLYQNQSDLKGNSLQGISIFKKQLFAKSLVLFGILMGFSFNSVQSQNCSCTGILVQNPSFENGTNNWNWSGGNLGAGNGGIACGSFSGDFQITNANDNWVSQTFGSVTLAAGTVINVSVYAGTHDPNLHHQVAVHYFDASWNWMSQTAVEVNKLLPGPQQYFITSTVPSGAYYVQVGFSGTGSWLKTDMWCATVSSACNNVTRAGTIGYDQAQCGGYDPANIQNLTLPTGGSGTIEYVWLKSTNNFASYTIIPGANLSSHYTHEGYASMWGIAIHILLTSINGNFIS